MTPRHLYLTDQDARRIEAVLTIRTAQRDRAYAAIGILATIAATLLAILLAVIS